MHIINKIVVRRVVTLTLTIFLVISGLYYFQNSQKTSEVVKAFGPLIVTFPSEPMFDSSSFYPGKKIEKTFTVENSDDRKQQVVIKASQIIIPSVAQLSEAINIIISQYGMSLYGTGSPTGNKTLAAFFAEKDGVKLSNINSFEKTDYVIALQMDNTAGNEYQNRSVSFDISVGLDTFGLVKIPTIASIPTIKPIPTIPNILKFPQFKLPFFNNRP